jgi:hypothetical protein
MEPGVSPARQGASPQRGMKNQDEDKLDLGVSEEETERSWLDFAGVRE